MIGVKIFAKNNHTTDLKQAGFSLLSVLIALLILSIFASLGYRQLHIVLTHQKARYLRQELASLLYRARIESLSLQVPLIVCGGTPKACASFWQEGIYLLPVDSTEVWASLKIPDDLTVYGPHKTLNFSPYVAQNFINATFTICSTLQRSFDLVINRQGRIRYRENPQNALCHRQ